MRAQRKFWLLSYGLALCLSLMPLYSSAGEASVCPIDEFSDPLEEDIGVRMSADRIRYLTGGQQAELFGNSLIQYQAWKFFSPNFKYDLENSGVTTSGGLYAQNKNMRLWSDAFDWQSEKKQMLFEGAVFTRCKGTKETLDWALYASELEYDEVNQSMDIYHARLWFKQVPIFYIPWVNVPLTRRSGLLVPVFGTKQVKEYHWGGSYYQQPIYLEFANNIDDTLSVAWLEDRSTLFSNEFRYLDQKNDMSFWIDHMARDDVLSQITSDTNKTYRRTYFKSKTQFSPSWSLQTNWLDIYPRHFHELLPENLFAEVPSGSVNRGAWLRGNSDPHRFTAQVHDNLSLIDQMRDTYQSVPKLGYRYQTNVGVRKSHQLSFNYTYNRLLSPEHRNLRSYQISQFSPKWQWTEYGRFYQTYVEFGWYRNLYELDSFESDTGVMDDSRDFSYANGYGKIGSELHFNNTQSWFSPGVKARLSPLLYYLRSPYQNPEHIPFQSYSALEIDTFRALLQVHRYNRLDYVGESNRVVGGVSQHLNTSDWHMRFTVGRNQDIDAPRTHEELPTLDSAFHRRFAEMQYNYQWFRMHINSQWDRNSDEMKKLFSQVYLEDSDKNVVRVNYTQDNEVEDDPEAISEHVGFGVSQKINPLWRLAGQASYDLNGDNLINNMVGFVYDSCCWQFNAVVTGTPKKDEPEETNYAVFLGFQFKGLMSLGPSGEPDKILYERASALR